MTSQNIYIISKSTHYDNLNKCYKKILTIDREPEGELKKNIKLLNNAKLSPFQENTPCSNYQHCLYVITNININNTTSFAGSCRGSCRDFLDIDRQGDLITFLLKNNYTIETDLTRLLIENNTSKDIVFAIKYNS